MEDILQELDRLEYHGKLGIIAEVSGIPLDRLKEIIRTQDIGISDKIILKSLLNLED